MNVKLETLRRLEFVALWWRPQIATASFGDPWTAGCLVEIALNLEPNRPVHIAMKRAGLERISDDLVDAWDNNQRARALRIIQREIGKLVH